MRLKLIIGSLVLAGMFFMCNGVNANTPKSKLIGVDTFNGVVKSVDTIENNVFLIVGGNNEDRVYYSSADTNVANDVLKLKIGDTIEVKYALGTPKKYKETTAMPLSKVKVIK